MIRALYSAGSGMTAQQMNVDNIAHNLANANTTGFKSRRAQFQDLLYQSLVQPGAAAGAADDGADRPATRSWHARLRRTRSSLRKATSRRRNPLGPGDPGHGFFQIRRPSGELAYTRAGRFPPRSRRQHGDVGRQIRSSRRSRSRRKRRRSRSRRRHGQLHAAGTNRHAAGRADSARQLSRIPPGLNSMGGNLYLPTDASGDATVGTPGGQEGLGIASCRAISSNRM